ncbi:DER1-domain-containing protein [Auriscalpium vulgare]|uniref:DER1-domain-containing protein n=1 Tax=Auriscalpium vulgare TaxID=40419 RepID=A0ACB8RJ85_9AGAM|nr:DER1-domain-containing protein [Auriscalpium vulgare]
MSYTGFWDEVRKIPPVTRFVAASSLAVSIPVMMQLVSPYKVVFVKDLVVYNWEIWRVWSSFFLGSSGINFIFDFAMLYRTSNQLEEGHFLGRSADFAWQLLVAVGGILALNVPLQTYVHHRALIVCLTYLSSALAPPGTTSSIMGMVTIPIQYFPYALIGMDLVMSGAQAAGVGVTGAVIGHLWWWWIFGDDGHGLPGLQEYGSAPRWVTSIVGANAPARTGPTEPDENDSQPRRPVRAAAAGEGGYQWGQGNRLGSD